MQGKSGQDPTAPGFELSELIAQEERYVFDHFSREDALRLGEIMLRLGKENGLPFGCEVYLGGMVVFKYMSEGVGCLNDLWMQKKLDTVLLTGWSTMRVWAMHDAIGMKRAPSMLPNEEFVMCGGGFPLNVKGLGTVGAIVCSGQGDQNEHQYLVDALKCFFEE